MPGPHASPSSGWLAGCSAPPRSLPPQPLPLPAEAEQSHAAAMEDDASSEISDWEVLSAASACGGGDDEVVIVSGGAGDVVHDHFALVPAAAGFAAEDPWLGSGEERQEEDWLEELQSVDGFHSIPRGSFDHVSGISSVQVLVGGGDDDTPERLPVEPAAECGEGLRAEGRLAEAVDAETGQEKRAICCGGLDSTLQPAQHDVGGTLVADATTVTDTPLEGGLSDSLDAKLEDVGVDAGAESSCLEAVVPTDGMQGGQDDQGQRNNVDAPSGCDESDVEVKDGSLPLVQIPGSGQGEGQGQVLWWRLPFRLLHYCAWKVKPVWSFSIAAALLGLAVLGRRMYRMRRKARGLPQIKIVLDEKRASHFADRASRINEAFLIAKRVPLLRTSPGAVLPWSMVQER